MDNINKTKAILLPFLVCAFICSMIVVLVNVSVNKVYAEEETFVANTDFTLSNAAGDLKSSLADGYVLVGQAGASSNSFGSFVSASNMSRKKGTIIKFATPIDTTKVKTLFFAVSKNIGANTVFDFYKNQSGITVGTSDPVASFTSTGSSYSSYSDRNTLFFITLYTSDLADAEGYIDSFIIIHESDERVDPSGNDDYAAFGTRIYSISANVIKANSEFKFTSSGIVASVADGYTAVGQAGTSVNSTLGEFVSSGMRRQYYSLIKFERPFDVRVFESISFYLGKNISANVTYDFYKNDSSITIGDTSQSGQTVVFSSTSNSSGADSASTVNTLTVNLLPFADSDGLVSGIIMAHTTDTRAEGDYSTFSQRVYNITANSRSNLYYKVSFNADNGSAVNYGFYGPTVTEPSDPVKAGKVFKWWYLNDESEEYDFSSLLTSDITLTALYVDTYNVSVNDPVHGTAVLSATEQGEGIETTLTITPDIFYELTSLKMNGVEVIESVIDGVYTFDMPSYNVAFVAEFGFASEYLLKIGDEFVITSTNKAGISLSTAIGPVTEGATGLKKYFINGIAEDTDGTVVKFWEKVNISDYNTAIIGYKLGNTNGPRVFKFYKDTVETDLSADPEYYYNSQTKTSESVKYMSVDLRALADANGDVDSFIISMLMTKGQTENLNFYSVMLTNKTFAEKSLGGNEGYYLRNDVYGLSGNLVSCFSPNEDLPTGDVKYISTVAGMLRGNGTAIKFAEAIYTSDYKAITFDISKNTSDNVIFAIYPLFAESLDENNAVARFTVGKSANETSNLIINLSDISENGICYGFIIVHESDDRVGDEEGSFSIRTYPIELKKQRTATFGGEGTEGIAPQTLDYGSLVVEPITIPVKASTAQYDYEFDGWYNGEEKWNFDDPLTANITLNSRFNAVLRTYIITFDGDDATEVAYGAKITSIPSDPEKIQTDYYFTFDGWYNGLVKWDFDVDTVSSAMNLTSKFIQGAKIPYTATFIADGVTVDTVTFYFDTESIAEPAVPTKTGYDGSWESYELITSDIEINAVYTAKYSLSLGLELKEDITARFVLNADSYTDIVFTVNDSVIEASEDGKYYFRNIYPQTLSTTLLITVTAINSSDEEEVLYEDKEVSLVSYLMNILDKTPEQLGYTATQTQKMKQLVVDLLYYADAAQTYTNTNTGNDIISGIDNEKYTQSTYVTPVSVRSLENNTGDYVWYSATLNYGNTVRLVFTVSSIGQAPDCIKLSIGGAAEVNISEYVANGTAEGRNLYKYYYDVSLVNFETEIIATIVVGEEEQSATLTYSVASYIVRRVATSSIDNEKELLKRVYCYGKSAYAFALSLHG